MAVRRACDGDGDGDVEGVQNIGRRCRDRASKHCKHARGGGGSLGWRRRGLMAGSAGQVAGVFDVLVQDGHTLL